VRFSRRRNGASLWTLTRPSTCRRSSQPRCDRSRALRRPGLDGRTDPVLVRQRYLLRWLRIARGAREASLYRLTPGLPRCDAANALFAHQRDLSGQAAASTPHDSADLIDREAAAHWGSVVHAPHKIPAVGRIGRNMIRYVLTLGQLIILCASSNAASVHHSRAHHHIVIRPGWTSSFAVVPGAYASPRPRVHYGDTLAITIRPSLVAQRRCLFKTRQMKGGATSALLPRMVETGQSS
jgi:hypothetical protein